MSLSSVSSPAPRWPRWSSCRVVAPIPSTPDAGGDIDGQSDQVQTDVALSGDAQDGAPLCTTPAITADCARGWCRIPEGCLVMGSPETEWGRAKYKEQQTATTLTRPFALGSFEVTQAQWMESGGRSVASSKGPGADARS